MNAPNARPRTPWAWVPSVYFAQGLPNVVVAADSVVVYKNLGLSNAAAAFYTSCLYLPWVVKPLWSPVVDSLRTRRWWVWSMQLMVAGGFALLALALRTSFFVPASLALFWLVAIFSATHDIGADGFYILANTERAQAAFSGVRSIAFNIAKICAQGGLVFLAGRFVLRSGDFASAWAMTFAVTAFVFLCLALYHRKILPSPVADREGSASTAGGLFKNFPATFSSFFRKRRIGILLCFLLFYRFGEAQLLKIAQPFLLDARAHGGLGFNNEQVSIVYGTAGVLALIFGGLLGGLAISSKGLKAWLWPMALIMHLPDAVFVYLAHAQPQNLSVITACITVEQFGYGFGFAAYMMYMIYIARGEHATAHYAICTGFMALGIMLPGMWSGWLQQHLGYELFFDWVLLATIPGFVLIWLIPLEEDFGRKS